jgi:hypothetical protein
MIRNLALVALVVSPTLAHAQGPLTGRLELACMGSGSANQVAQASANAWDSNGNYGGANIVGTRSVGFEDQVNLWIEGAEGRIRMPRSMLPAIRGGEDGWFKLKSVVVNDREITASVAVNPLNNPKVRVDRITGMISLSGKAGDFAGRCRKYDPNTVERAF